MIVVLKCSISSAQNTDSLIVKYIAIKNALVESNNAAARTAITNFSSIYTTTPESKQNKELKSALDKLASANTLEAQRQFFNTFSVAFWKLIKDSKSNSQSIYYQYCPMKKAYWVSQESEIKNPYYGSSMLSCGKVIEKLDK